MANEDLNHQDSGPVIRQIEVGPLQTNCYLLKSGAELVVIDPGGDGDEIIRQIGELGGTVKYVLNTHGHIDHIAANGAVLAAYPAEILIHELDARMLTVPDLNLSTLMGMFVSSPAPARLLADGDEIEIGSIRLEVVHTPGHTPGSVCFLGPGFAFTGDTLFLDSIGRVDFPGGSERAMRQSLARLQRLLRPETVIYPGHGPSGNFGRALLINPFLGGLWTV